MVAHVKFRRVATNHSVSCLFSYLLRTRVVDRVSERVFDGKSTSRRTSRTRILGIKVR